jgi:hypothetical protein
MGTGGTFPGVKRGSGVTLTTHLHIVPRYRMSRSYTPFLPSAYMACSGATLLCFNNKWWRVQSMEIFLSSFLHPPVTSPLSYSNILLSTLPQPFKITGKVLHHVNLWLKTSTIPRFCNLVLSTAHPIFNTTEFRLTERRYKTTRGHKNADYICKSLSNID